MAVAGRQWDDDDDDDIPWHNRTPEVVGASVAGILVVGIVIWLATFVANQATEPEQAPLEFVDPTYSATATYTSTPTTTATITRTSPPVTSDIGTPATTTSSSGTSTTTATTTSRSGPRTNVTRTLYPQP